MSIYQCNKKLWDSRTEKDHRFIKIFKKIDIFPYSIKPKDTQGEDDARSITGAVASIAYIIFICFLVRQVVLNDFQKLNPLVKETKIQQNNPGESNISNSTIMRPMVAIQGLDLASGKYFTATMEYKNVTNGKTTIHNIPLHRCSQEDFDFKENGDKNYIEDIGLDKFDKYLCLPKDLNMSIILQGFKNAPIFTYLRLSISRCVNDSIKTDCASNALIDELIKINKSFFLNFVFVNPNINPGLQNYESYYLQNRYYLEISPGITKKRDLFIEEYNLRNDESLNPFFNDMISIEPQTYMMIDSDQQNSAIQDSYSTPNTFGVIYIRKSFKRIEVERSFTKVDETISYLGGLCGIIYFLFKFVFQKYNEYSYLISFAAEMLVHSRDNGEQILIKQSEFNILTYPFILIQDLIGFFCSYRLCCVGKLYDSLKAVEPNHQFNNINKNLILLNAFLFKVHTNKYQEFIKHFQCPTFRQNKSLFQASELTLLKKYQEISPGESQDIQIIIALEPNTNEFVFLDENNRILESQIQQIQEEENHCEQQQHMRFQNLIENPKKEQAKYGKTNYVVIEDPRKKSIKNRRR